MVKQYLIGGSVLAIVLGGLYINQSAYDRGKGDCEAKVARAVIAELEKAQRSSNEAQGKLINELERLKSNDKQKAIEAARAVDCGDVSDVVRRLRAFEAGLPLTPK